MMADKRSHSDSDDSDEDYLPDDKITNLSEEEESGDAESEMDEERDKPKSRKRQKTSVPQTKEDDTVCEKNQNLDVDALWADFKNDTAETKKAVVKPAELSKPTEVPAKLTPITVPTGSKGGGGLASVLGKIGKKDKLSTLEKSRLDWNNFKRAEGIEEDLQKHNRGKDGFLERKDFLERTDLRQFEIEKQLRTVKRSMR